MKKILILTFLLAFLGFQSCTKHDAKGNEIKDYDEIIKAKWLVGEWQKVDTLGTLKEIWTSQDDSTFIGKSLFIQNEKDTLHNEQIELFQDKEHLIYRTIIKGENNDSPISYQMTKDTDSVLVFENPKYDYPQKIEYKLLKNGNLIATISGKERGKLNSKSYQMNKSK